MYQTITAGTGEAEAAFNRVKSMDASLLSEFPDDPAILDHLTEHWVQIATWRQHSPTGSGGSVPDWEQLLDFYKTQSAAASGSTALAKYWASAYRGLAHKLEQMQRLGEAKEALRRALKLTPDDPDLQSNLARLLVLRAESPSPVRNRGD